LKSMVFYCDSGGRAALVRALKHLGVIHGRTLTFRELLRLSWWPRIAVLPPGRLLEIGCDERGFRVFILWVNKDRELLPRLADSFPAALEKKADWIFVNALPNHNRWIAFARKLASLVGNNSLTHYFFLHGLTKLKEK
jgi:hypothetical protein